MNVTNKLMLSRNYRIVPMGIMKTVDILCVELLCEVQLFPVISHASVYLRDYGITYYNDEWIAYKIF